MRTNKDPVQLIAERYQNDPAGFSTRFTNIFTSAVDHKPYKLYPKQVEFMNLIKPHEKVTVAYKCRQSGFSTCIKGKSLQKAYFKKAPQFLIASAGLNQSAKVLRDIKAGFGSMPEFMRPEYKKDTDHLIILNNGVEIYSLPFNPESCRGFTGDVFLDEFGVKNRKDSGEIWEALAPTITHGYNITMVSSPKGKNNMFYDFCNPNTLPRDEEGNIDGAQADKIIRIHWSDVPFIANQIEAIRKRFHSKQFAQEYDCQFLDDAETALFTRDFMLEHVVDQRNLLKLVDTTCLLSVLTDTVPDEMKFRELYTKYPGGVYCGWDIAISGDGSILGAFGIQGDGTWELFAWHVFPKGTELKHQIPYVSLFCQLLCAKKITIDSTGAFGKTALSLLKDTKIGGIAQEFVFTSISKAQEYSMLYSKMEAEGFRIPNIDECVKQFSNLGLNPITGRIAAMGGKGEHDDWPSMFICAYSGRKLNLVEPGFTIIRPRRY